MSEEDLQMAEKIRKVKGKGEKDRYTQIYPLECRVPKTSKER